uniref:BTB domain-containing protein n=1 Tax=Panagrolaimus sp. JU765 TaxID=591449 RepID=A0AC34RLZ1_9BILA
MVCEIVQNLSINVPEHVFNKFIPFYSDEYQIPGFEKYSFNFAIHEILNKYITIAFWPDFPKPVHVSCDFTVNSITKTIIGTFEDSRSYNIKFGKKDELVVNGSMKLDIKLDFKLFSENVEVVEKKQVYAVPLLDDERFKDFTFCVGNQEINVHKNIVAVASPVFSAMLQPHCKESQEGKVVIKEFDFETVKAGVEFMYGKEPHEKLPIKTLLNLCKFADKYDLKNKLQLFEKMYKKINLETIAEISKLAKANFMDELYNKCVDFFVINFDKNMKNIKKYDDLDLQFIADVVKKHYHPKEC